jgi:hypothetical protein
MTVPSLAHRVSDEYKFKTTDDQVENGACNHRVAPVDGVSPPVASHVSPVFFCVQLVGQCMEELASVR